MSGLFAGQRRRVVALVAAAVVGVGMIAACGSQSAEPEEKDWSEGDQQEQDNGKQQTGEGKPAESEEPEEPEEFVFVKEYVDAINTAMKSGDASEMRELSTDDCRGCEVLANFQEELHENGGKYLDDPSFEVVELVQGPEGKDPTWVRIAKKQPEVGQIQEEGGPEKTVGGITDYSEFGLVQEKGTWKVAEFCGVTENQPQGCW